MKQIESQQQKATNEIIDHVFVSKNFNTHQLSNAIKYEITDFATSFEQNDPSKTEQEIRHNLISNTQECIKNSLERKYGIQELDQLENNIKQVKLIPSEYKYLSKQYIELIDSKNMYFELLQNIIDSHANILLEIKDKNYQINKTNNTITIDNLHKHITEEISASDYQHYNCITRMEDQCSFTQKMIQKKIIRIEDCDIKENNLYITRTISNYIYNQYNSDTFFITRYWQEALNNYYKEVTNLIKNETNLSNINTELFKVNLHDKYINNWSNIYEKKVKNTDIDKFSSIEKLYSSFEKYYFSLEKAEKILIEKRKIIEKETNIINNFIEEKSLEEWNMAYLSYLESEHNGINNYLNSKRNDELLEICHDIQSMQNDYKSRFVNKMCLYNDGDLKTIAYHGDVQDIQNTQQKIEELQIQLNEPSKTKNIYAMVPIGKNPKNELILQKKALENRLEDSKKTILEIAEHHDFESLIDSIKELVNRIGNENTDWKDFFDKDGITINEYFNRLTSYVKSNITSMSDHDRKVATEYERMLAPMSDNQKSVYIELATQLSQSYNRATTDSELRDQSELKNIISFRKYFEKNQHYLAKHMAERYFYFENKYNSRHLYSLINKNWWTDYQNFLKDNHDIKNIQKKKSDNSKIKYFLDKNKEQIDPIHKSILEMKIALEPIAESKFTVHHWSHESHRSVNIDQKDKIQKLERTIYLLNIDKETIENRINLENKNWFKNKQILKEEKETLQKIVNEIQKNQMEIDNINPTNDQKKLIATHQERLLSILTDLEKLTTYENDIPHVKIGFNNITIRQYLNQCEEIISNWKEIANNNLTKQEQETLDIFDKIKVKLK